MDILVAGLGDVGGPLAVQALRRQHNVWGLDTWHEHQDRLELLKLPLKVELAFPWGALREMEHHGMYTQLYEGDEVPAFDAAIVTPNCMINDAPHIRWTRFEREMKMIGRKLKPGNLVILHCLSLRGAEMMRDAEAILHSVSELSANEQYCLTWTGLLDGEYQNPETQDVFVDGWRTPGCVDRTLELMGELVGTAKTLQDLQKTSA